MMLYFKQYPSSVALIFCVIVSKSNTITTTIDSIGIGMIQNCGNLCSYIDQCNNGYYEENIFMQSLCESMIREVLHINDETEVLKIEGGYIHKFHQYDIEKYVVREKRSSRRKVIINCTHASN